MVGRVKLPALIAVLLALVVLGAQLHSCEDLTAGPLASHVCPICSVAATVIVAAALLILLMPAADRLEIRGITVSVPLVVPQNLTLRGPPSYR
jgi:hypothetical protein